jgi:hypothetical protein
MKHFELLVGTGLVVLGLILFVNCVIRSRRGMEQEGLPYVVVSNLFMGTFLIMFARGVSGGGAVTVMLLSAMIGFGAAILVTINVIRQVKKNPFD